ncbi:MAG: (Fe-S)-binding protein [Nitrososphaerales archaeon]
MAKFNKLDQSDYYKLILRCVHCGFCLQSCPTYRLLGIEADSPRGRLYLTRAMVDKRIDIAKDVANHLYKCTMCANCEIACPSAVKYTDIMFITREIMAEANAVPLGAEQLVNTINNAKNIFMMDNTLRKDWVIYTGVEAPIKDKADMVYFVGCVTSYSGRIQGVAQAIASILNYVGEDWTLLKDEWCCGHPLKLEGATKEFKKVAEHNVKMIEETGATKVVSGCPGCCLALKKEYPEVLGRKLNFEVLHFSQILDEYIKKGKLKIPKFESKVTYHDPCELGRILGIINEPRRVIKSISDKFVEPIERGKEGFCCGGGGLLKVTDSQLSESIANKRLEMLIKTGAEVIISACPTCYQSLADATSRKNKALQVIDIAELIAQRLGLM